METELRKKVREKARRSKTALVMAGGGLTGAVYEIGALRAIDDLLVDRTVNDFDIYVGTSAGSIVSSFIANGISPEEMLQVIDGTHPFTHTIERKHLFNLNFTDYLRWGVKLPFKVLDAWLNYLKNLGDMTLFDLMWTMSEALPPGFYDPSGLKRFIHDAMMELGVTDDFNALKKDLFLVATDLDSGQRAIFGRGYNEASISSAVSASCALPMVYKPVRINGHDYIDGGTRGNASIDLAIEQGAKLVVCVNPLVPFDNQKQDKIPFLDKEGGHLSEKGVQSIVNQVFRIMLHSGLHYHVKQLRRAHPEVDIILIEPSAEDYQMFFYNIMRYSARLVVARHGFESATVDLAVDYPYYRNVLARHGIPISRRLVIEELAEIINSDQDPQVIRRILEARSPGCGSRRRSDPLCRLEKSLEALDEALDELKPD
ncbi:MAG: patatin-like phospholipase family protein [Chloroflexota bacterium]